MKITVYRVEFAMKHVVRDCPNIWQSEGEFDSWARLTIIWFCQQKPFENFSFENLYSAEKLVAIVLVKSNDKRKT